MSLWRCPTQSWTECRYCPGLRLFGRQAINALLTPAAVCPGQANALHPLMVIGGLAPSEREALLGGDTLHGERVFIAYM